MGDFILIGYILELYRVGYKGNTMSGRPSKYNEQMQEKAEQYLKEYEQVGDAVPSAVGLARFLSVNKDTIYEWGDVHEQFSDTLGDIKAEQERRLTNGGLMGEYNSNIAKLMLANHGYGDKQNIDLSGGVNITVDSEGFGKL